jgi:hypothetical protein
VMRSAAVWLLILVTATGFAIAGRQGVAYVRATRGNYGLAQESQVRPAIPVFESLRALDGSSVPRDRDAIVLLYSSRCKVCNYNMANWISLILAANQEYPKTMVAAVSVEPAESQRAYWSSLSDEGVRLFTSPNVTALTTSLGTDNVPSTIVIHDGKIVGNFLGILGPARQARALRLLQ